MEPRTYIYFYFKPHHPNFIVLSVYWRCQAQDRISYFDKLIFFYSTHATIETLNRKDKPLYEQRAPITIIIIISVQQKKVHSREVGMHCYHHHIMILCLILVKLALTVARKA